MPAVPYSAQQSWRARQLAAGLTAARIKLPPPVAAAIAAMEQARAVPPVRPAEPGSLVRAAWWEAARQALDNAPPGRSPEISTAPVEEARRAEQESRDRHEVHTALIAESEARLTAAVRNRKPALVAAIQDRHAAAVAELTGAARQLPPAVDDRQALEQGGEIRSNYLKARDLVTELGQLRALLADIVADEQADLRGDREFALTWCRSRWFYERRYKFPKPPGSLPFWLKLARECPEGDIWCPTPAQVEEAAERMRKEDRGRKIQQLPRNAVVF